jgi:hypothetical protein
MRSLDAETGLPFDHIRVKEGDRDLVLSAKALLALPLHTRVRWLLNDSLEFYSGDERVDRRVALAALRTASTTRA